jgi:hypothetical protein
MKAGRILWLGVLASSCLAISAEAPQELIGRVGSSSFSINIPTGWKVVAEGAAGSNLVFELAPIEPVERGSASNLMFAYYTKEMLNGSDPKSRIISANRLADPGSTIVELPYMQGLLSWTFLESAGRRNQRISLTAYTNIGLDVLWASLTAPEGRSYLQAKEELLRVLQTYREESVSLE